MLRGKVCPSFARCCSPSITARRRGSPPTPAPSQTGWVTEGMRLLRFQVGQQESRVEIALHWSTSTRTGVPALRSWFLVILPTLMALLRQFGLVGRDARQGAASFCNYASHMRYKQPWCAKSYASTILLLPCFERGFFDRDRGAHLRNGDAPTCHAGSCGVRPVCARCGRAVACRLVPLALFPAQASCRVLTRPCSS